LNPGKKPNFCNIYNPYKGDSRYGGLLSPS